MNNMTNQADLKNKAKSYTRVEAGTIQPITFDVYEDDLKNHTDVLKKEVFCKALKKHINTRVIKFGKVYVHALFFEDGKVYDVNEKGFKLRELHGEAIRW